MKIKLFLMIFLTGCMSVQDKPVDIPLSLPKAPELKMRTVEWNVLRNEDSTYMCLTPEAYSNMSLNVQDLKIYMLYQNKVIKILEDYK